MDDTEITVEEPVEADSVVSLLEQYNNVKRGASQDVTALSTGLTLRSMDSINEVVAKGVMDINSYINNGRPKGAVSVMTSKALAVIDPSNSWAGKWLSDAKQEVSNETLLEQSIGEIVTQVVGAIETKKQEVIEFIQSAVVVREQMTASVKTYEELLKKAVEVLSTYDEYSRESYETKSLIVNLTATIENTESDISNIVNTLIASANITVGEITKKLPSIENELMYKGEFKNFQQSISDLNGIMNTAVEMANTTGEIVRKDINQTINKSLELLGDNGIDMERVKRIKLEEVAQRKKVNALMYNVKTKLDKDFADMQQLKLELDASREEDTNNLIENFAK
jgi:hypothetical protein